jgi:glycosyltransferase involved in cell wall biosynthesis
VDLSVLIATAHRPGLLERTLDSVAEARLPSGLRRVLVVENGDSRSAPEVCARFSDRLPIECHHVAQRGKGAATQFGLESIATGLVVFFDDDVRIGKNVLTSYVEAAEEHGPDFFYGGPVSIDYEEAPPSWLLEFLPYSARGWDWSVSDWRWFLGFNWAAFAEPALRLGGARADLGPGANERYIDSPTGMETEMQRRMVDAGMERRFVEDARVWHWVPKDRCSVAWALERAQRNGISEGLQAPEWLPRWCGVPRWALRRLAEEAGRRGLAPFRREPIDRFRPRWELARISGYLRGSWRNRRASGSAR